MSPPRAPVVAWAALLIAVLCLSLRGWGSFQLGVYQDDAIYTVLAHSLAGGEQFGMIDGPRLGPPPFSFGFPLILAPAVRLFPEALEGLGAVSLAATLLNVSLLFWGWTLLSPRTSRWWGLVAASLYGLAPTVIGQTRMVMSEPVYTSLALTAVLLTEAVLRRRTLARLVALGAVIALAAYTRTIGATLVAVVGIRFLFARRGRDLGLVAAGGIALLAVVVVATPVDFRHLLPARYLEDLRRGPAEADSSSPRGNWDYVEVLASYALLDVRRVVIPFGSGEREAELAESLGVPAAPRVVGGLVTAIVVFGAWRAFTSGALCATVLLFEIFHVGVVLLWPWSSTRHLYPIQALLSFQFVYGAADLIARVARPRAARGGSDAGARAAALVAMILALLSLRQSARIVDSRVAARDLTLGTTWLAENTPPDAIVLGRFPASLYLRSGRRAIDVPRPLDAATLRRELDQGVGYVLVAPDLAWTRAAVTAAADPLRELVAARDDAELVYESEADEVRVYRMRR